MSVQELADRVLDLVAEEDPLADYLEGYPGFEHRLARPDAESEADLRARAVERAAACRALGEQADGRLTCALALQQAESVVTRLDARLVEHTMVDYSVSPVGRLLIALPMLRPGGDEAQQAFLARLRAVPAYLAAAAARHRAGVRSGRPPVAERAHRAIEMLDDYLADPGADPLLQVPLAERWAGERDRLLAGVVRPAFAAYREVLRQEVAPHGRPPERAGLCWLPDGEETYAALARTHTTTSHTPKELHQIGLDLIAALAEEYADIGGELFGLHGVGEVQERMRTDPALRWGSGEELLASARAAIDRAEAAAPGWFGWVPQPCALEAVPASAAPSAPAAYYIPPPVDGSRPGTYFANTYDATSRTRYLAEATAFHEAVPGHHYQLTLAQGLDTLPLLRRVACINAYIEGWGLYAERLADEMDLYSGPLARLGMLAMDSMRAARLVVDTGLHAFGWSRQRVVEYLRDHTVMSEVEIQQETDRYIEFPGQALSYMVGRLELQRLRARAEARLGETFDVRAFHDVVLGSGPLPLPVLDRLLAEWEATAATRR